MNSLLNYQNNYFNYYNSLSNSLINQDFPLNESLLVQKHGKSIDNVLYKLDLCSYREANPNYIFEAKNDILFTLDEQYAARDLLLLTCKIYVEQMCNEYNLDVPIMEDEQSSIGGLKNFIQRASQAAKNKASEFKDNLIEVKDKFKSIAEFVKQITSKAISSAKELANKFIELMISIKDTLGKIFEKLGGKIEEIQKEYTERITEVINNKSKRPKETIYENLQEYLNNNNAINEDIINEFLGFGKKKKDNEQSNKDNNKDNEYEQSLNKNEKSSKSTKGGNIILAILKQVAISVTILIIIPALVGCAWGPAAAMIAATIAKAIMTGYGFYKYCKNIYTTIKSGKFKEASKWKKLGYIFLWVVSFALLAWGAKKAGEDIIQCWDAFKNSNLKQLVPDETIQSGMKLINKIWKSITGKDTPGVEELNKITENGIVEWEKIEETKGKTNDAFTEKQLKNFGDTNDFDKIQNNLGEDITKNLKDVADASLKTSKQVQDAAIKAVDPSSLPSDTHVVFLDGNTAAKMARDGLLSGTEGAKVAVHQITNTALQSSTHGQAGTLFMVVVKGSKESAENIAQQAMSNAASHNVSALAKVISGTATETVTKMIPHHLPLISGGFAPIVALPTIFKKKVNKGFLLRLGSSRSGNNIYPIKEDGIKGMTFSELEKKYGDKNGTVINNMKKIINTNYKTLEEAHKKLESKNDLSKEEKKRLDAITKQIEKMKSGVEDYECLIFYSNKVVEAENPQETNEGLIDKLFSKKEKPKQKEIEYQPIMFINPLCMACGDLADSTKKRGPRKKPIYLKGLFASYEFLPGSEGMNENDLNELITSIALESLKTAWNMTADSPCIKTGKKYEENTESIYKDKERYDFGTFTNKEITEIFNNPNTISKYMNGKYSKRSTVEKENTENQKQRKENAKKEWKNNIENNEEVKEIIDKSPSLKKNLLDDEGHVKPEALDELSDSFLRMETNYNKGKDKKTLWQKIKSFFIGDNDKQEKYDAKEVQNLAYKLASLHAKKLKSKRSNEKVQESIEELDYIIKCFEMNTNDLMTEEFINFIKTNQINEEKYYDVIELIEE